MIDQLIEIFKPLIDAGIFVYAYCTDFIINTANLTGLSYYEVNALIFCIIWPLITVILMGIYVILKIKLSRRLKKV